MGIVSFAGVVCCLLTAAVPIAHRNQGAETAERAMCAGGGGPIRPRRGDPAPRPGVLARSRVPIWLWRGGGPFGSLSAVPDRSGGRRDVHHSRSCSAPALGRVR